MACNISVRVCFVIESNFYQHDGTYIFKQVSSPSPSAPVDQVFESCEDLLSYVYPSLSWEISWKHPDVPCNYICIAELLSSPVSSSMFLVS